MANDDETLTFRLRAVAENMGAFGKAARGAEDVNVAMIKSRKTAEALIASNSKLTAARDKEADAAGRVRTAEARLDEVRKNTKAKLSQIAAAEERVATARRNSARASSEANRIEKDFKALAEKAIAKSAEDAGLDAGRRFHLGFGKSMKSRGLDDEVESGSRIIGSTFGSGILNGLSTALRSKAGPAILASLIAVAAIVSPAIGAVLAGGIVGAFGTGLAALAIVFAAKSEAVRAKWKATAASMGSDLKLISEPFQDVLIHIANTMETAFGRLAPVLQEAFKISAGPIQKFADDLIAALERFKPSLLPVTRGFNTLLASLGPALQDAIGSISDGLIDLSNSVSRNPTGLPDLIRGIGTLTKELLQIIGYLNDANGAFERLTGGTSAVTVTVNILRVAVHTLLAPIILLAKYIQLVSSVVDALRHGTDASGQSMSEAANKTAMLAQELQRTGGVAGKTAPAVKSVAEKAADAAKAFEDWIDQLFRLSGLAISVAQSQVNLGDAINRATTAIKDNGKNTSLNTEKGRANRQALVDVAKAARDHTEALIRNGKAHGIVETANVGAYNAAVKSRQGFVKLAIQMGFNSKTAQQMAVDMIAIPNVSREARLTANKKDLETKLADAKRALDDKDLTKERRAQINANITALTKALATAQSQINALKGKTIEIKYTSSGVNLTTPSRVGGLAGGGQVVGRGSGTDDRAGVFALSNKEWVIRAKASQKYGDYAMASVNAGTATIIPGMATGGKAFVNINSRGVFNSVAQGRAILTQMLGGPALAFAKSQAGKPYLWGGVGPSGYDCSGFQSAIVNVIRGQYPYRRLFSTGTLPGGLFEKGSGRFNVGWFKGNPGHMAGTLNGVNVESRGGRGVVVGPGARGAGDSLFNSGVWHLKGYAKGGKVGVGDPPYDGFVEWLQTLKSYARGTSYVPSDGLAYLHRGERVTPRGEPMRLHPADIQALADALMLRPIQLVLDGRVIHQSLLKQKNIGGGFALGLE